MNLMDFSSISSGIQAISQIKQLFDALKDGENRLEAQTIQIQLTDAIFNVQQSLMEAQQNNYQLQEENRKLSKQLAAIKDWEGIKENYQLHSFSYRDTVGSTVYKLKESKVSQELPLHYLCPRCFENKIKSMINLERFFSSGRIYACPNCKAEYREFVNR
jgi:conserved hypothetical protein